MINIVEIFTVSVETDRERILLEKKFAPVDGIMFFFPYVMCTYHTNLNFLLREEALVEWSEFFFLKYFSFHICYNIKLTIKRFVAADCLIQISWVQGEPSVSIELIFRCLFFHFSSSSSFFNNLFFKLHYYARFITNEVSSVFCFLCAWCTVKNMNTQ